MMCGLPLKLPSSKGRIPDFRSGDMGSIPVGSMRPTGGRFRFWQVRYYSRATCYFCCSQRTSACIRYVLPAQRPLMKAADTPRSLDCRTYGKSELSAGGGCLIPTPLPPAHSSPSQGGVRQLLPCPAEYF